MRRLQLSLFALFGIALGFSPPSAKGIGGDAESKKPNVIIILTDDQGSVDMGAYGSDDLKTPAMDALAKTGVRFTQFYAAAPVCSPSRAGLLTGLYPVRAGRSFKCTLDQRQTRDAGGAGDSRGDVQGRRVRDRPHREMAPRLYGGDDAERPRL